MRILPGLRDKKREIRKFDVLIREKVYMKVRFVDLE
jgi:hypothetical protein